MKLTLCSRAVARLTFHRDDDARVDVPEDLEVFDCTTGAPERLAPTDRAFYLGWTDNYRVKYRGELVVTFENQRQWAVVDRRAPETL